MDNIEKCNATLYFRGDRNYIRKGKCNTLKKKGRAVCESCKAEGLNQKQSDFHLMEKNHGLLEVNPFDMPKTQYRKNNKRKTWDYPTPGVVYRNGKPWYRNNNEENTA